MKYWTGILCLTIACVKPTLKEVNLIPKPQKIEIKDGAFSLNFNTNLIFDRGNLSIKQNMGLL